MQILYSILGFLIAIGILVTIHEFGHFWVARRVGVKVHRFSIGFGKPLKIWKRKNDETEYVLAAIPLGGYVKMLDERIEEVDEAEKHLAFNRQTLPKRTAIVAAGPLANFLFAILAMWALYMVGMRDHHAVIGGIEPNSIAERVGFAKGERIVKIDDNKIYGWRDSQLYLIHKSFQKQTVTFSLENELSGDIRQVDVDMGEVGSNVISKGVLIGGLGLIPAQLSNIISSVVKGQPAQLAGLQGGDKITQIDDTVINDWRDLVTVISERPTQTVALDYQRDGQTYSATLEVGSVTHEGKVYGQIGVHASQYTFSTGAAEGLLKSLDYTWRFTAVSLWSMAKMFTREVSTENLSGPITIANMAGTTLQRGIGDFVQILIVISISLGLINLLPVPVLDGGHLLFFAIEAIKGSPVSEKVMIFGQQVGIAMLLLLMSFAFYNDIMRLIS